MIFQTHRALLCATAAAGLLAVSSNSASAECYRFGDIVTFSGIFAPGVTVENGNRDPRGLAGRTSDLLLFDGLICVFADPVSRHFADAGDVQLRCPDLVLQKGERVTLRGRLFGAHTGNGHTPILLACRDG
jgi:hypothetical protein